MIREFRDFINRGNFVDLAVAFVMGVAFNAITTSLVDRLIMPVIGLVFGQPNFEAVGRFGCETVDGAEQCAGSVGAVLTAVVNFLIIAFTMFLVVKAYNSLKERSRRAATEPGAEEPAPPEDVALLREIRDALTTR